MSKCGFSPFVFWQVPKQKAKAKADLIPAELSIEDLLNKRNFN
jgi:hypothetical protein